MTETVIKLSRAEAATLMSNAEWINSIPKSVTLYDGDQIYIKEAFLEEAQSNQTYVIIKEPVTITFEFVPYITMGPQRDIIDGNGYMDVNALNPDVPMCCFEAIPNTFNPSFSSGFDSVWIPMYAPRIKTFTMVIPASVFTPVELAQFITDKMSKVNFSQDPVTGFPVSDNGFLEFYNKDPLINVVDNLQRLGNNIFVPVGHVLEDEIYAWLDDHGCGVYQPPASYRNPDLPPPGSVYSYMIMLGAQECGIEYTDGVYKLFNFCGFTQPNSTDSSDWCVSFQYNATKNKFEKNRTYGGVIFTGYNCTIGGNKADFMLDVLGIDMSKIIVDPAYLFNQTVDGDPDAFTKKYGDVSNYITPLKMSISNAFVDLCQLTYGTAGSVNQPSDLARVQHILVDKVTDIDYPNGFIGSPVADLSTGGHFLISIQSMPQAKMYGQFYDGQISMIASRQYNYSKTITAYSESSVIYTHVGDPIDLQNFHIMIKSPNTMNPVKNSSIGTESHIYLSIVHNYQASLEVQKKEKRLLRKK